MGRCERIQAGLGSTEPFYVPVLDRLVRWRWAVLTAWCCAQWWVVRDHTGDWAFFDSGARQVFGATIGAQHLAGGVHTYAHDPLQFGPPPILLAELARFSGAGRALFGIAAMALCLPALWLLEDTAQRLAIPPSCCRQFVALAGLVLVPAWGILAFGATHMDDALVLLGAAAVGNLLARDRPMLAAIVAGSAAAAKPWGLITLGLLFMPTVRRPYQALAIGVVTLLVWWAPFLVDPHTIASAGGARIPVGPDTPLHLLVPDAAMTPLWVRPVQLVVGTVLTAVTARRRPWGALTVGIAFRLLIDPGGYSYYWCGLLFVAIAHDLLTGRRWAVLTAISWFLSLDWPVGRDPTLHGVVSLVGLVTCAVLAVAPRPSAPAGLTMHRAEPDREGSSDVCVPLVIGAANLS